MELDLAHSKNRTDGKVTKHKRGISWPLHDCCEWTGLSERP